MNSVTKPSAVGNRFQPGLCLAILAGLFTFAIPWWWQFIPESAHSIQFGAPTWAVSAVFGSFLISCFAAVMLHRAWSNLEQQEDGDAEDAPDDASEKRSRQEPGR